MIRKSLLFFHAKWFSCVVILTIMMNILILLIPSCSNSETTDNQAVETLNQDVLIDTNKGMMQNEAIAIDAYVERRGYDMIITSSGLRYMIYDSSGSGPKASTDDLVTVSYQVSLLNGEEIYNSQEHGDLTFVLEKSEIARGLQEGLKHLSKGDKALMIIPAHLAYGLTGDGNKISHYDAIVVDTELTSISKQ